MVSSNYIPRGTFICEYSGQLLSNEEAMKNEQKYENDNTIGCYMYYFMFRGEKYWYESLCICLYIHLCINRIIII